MKTNRPAGFLNVDLEIESSGSLEMLVEEMGKAVFVLHSGPGNNLKHLLCLESSRWSTTVEEAARALCSVVERLSPRGRKVWDRAKLKRFDVGYELPNGAHSVHDALRPETLARIVALGGTVAFSFYRADNGEPDGPANGNQPDRPKTKRTSSAAGSRRRPHR